MGTISRAYNAFISLATDNGTVHDRGTVFMFVAAALICLLSIYFVYNVAAMTINGVRRVVQFGLSFVTVVDERMPAEARSIA